MPQIQLFPSPATLAGHPTPGIAVTPELERLLALDAVVAFNISSGKDGFCSAVTSSRYLDAIGHRGPRLCIHADLGSVERKETPAVCRMQADYLGLPLVVVQRTKGGLMERWHERWEGNVRRYAALETLTLVLLWSTARFRFCTSESKSHVLAAALKNMFPGRVIVSATGIRREESVNRAAKPIIALNKLLTRKNLPGYDWHPVIEYRLADVLATNDRTGVPRHVAYSIFGSSRLSCTYCMLATLHDHQASAACAGNHDIYREIVGLEADSTFSFQSERWLADAAPHLLGPGLRAAIARAKEAAQTRMRLEAPLPAYLRLERGVPAIVPTHDDAALVASVRAGVARAVGIDVGYTSAATVRERYAELIALAAAKPAKVKGHARNRAPTQGQLMIA